MKKAYLEILAVILFVTLGSIFVYSRLASIYFFWNSQFLWSIILVICWAVVSFGYFHQGLIVRKAKSATHVSVVLPSAVFVVQCVLFIKGVYYKDRSLIIGALLVNSGVIFSLWQLAKFRKNKTD